MAFVFAMQSLWQIFLHQITKIHPSSYICYSNNFSLSAFYRTDIYIVFWCFFFTVFLSKIKYKKTGFLFLVNTQFIMLRQILDNEEFYKEINFVTFLQFISMLLGFIVGIYICYVQFGLFGRETKSKREKMTTIYQLMLMFRAGDFVLFSKIISLYTTKLIWRLKTLTRQVYYLIPFIISFIKNKN
jgi:hypothetical protein